MMKAFIIFRGHLVEVRYADNPAARSKAFDAMLDWIQTTEHHEIWKRYLDKIVPNKRSHPDILPKESFDAYRGRLYGK